jgi:hypothetical protein
MCWFFGGDWVRLVAAGEDWKKRVFAKKQKKISLKISPK